MIEILGKKYLTTKELPKRYGYSSSWFVMMRKNPEGPKFIKIKTGAKIMYPLDDTDKWFTALMGL